MIISSEPYPMAYVLSNNNDDIHSPLCVGQHLFKFDPKKITANPPGWTKKTIGSNSNNCGHLGLIFGRSECIFYAFSFFNGQSTVTLLDTSLNSIW
jgi:hypothetical protein